MSRHAALVNQLLTSLPSAAPEPRRQIRLSVGSVHIKDDNQISKEEGEEGWSEKKVVYVSIIKLKHMIRVDPHVQNPKIFKYGLI